MYPKAFACTLMTAFTLPHLPDNPHRQHLAAYASHPQPSRPDSRRMLQDVLKTPSSAATLQWYPKRPRATFPRQRPARLAQAELLWPVQNQSDAGSRDGRCCCWVQSLLSWRTCSASALASTMGSRSTPRFSRAARCTIPDRSHGHGIRCQVCFRKTGAMRYLGGGSAGQAPYAGVRRVLCRTVAGAHAAAASIHRRGTAAVPATSASMISRCRMQCALHTSVNPVLAWAGSLQVLP